MATPYAAMAMAITALVITTAFVHAPSTSRRAPATVH
jgi:hypothetical protein